MTYTQLGHAFKAMAFRAADAQRPSKWLLLLAEIYEELAMGMS